MDGEDIAGQKDVGGPDHNHALSNQIMKETISAIHKSSYHKDSNLRSAAIASLETVAVNSPLLVLQTWIDHFTTQSQTTNDYASQSRIFLLQSLEKIVKQVVEVADNFGGDGNVAHKACIGRILSTASEELTKLSDVVPEIQKPCSSILVLLATRFLDRVMDCVLLKFQPNVLPHFYAVSCMESLAHAFPLGVVPYLKGILTTMVANMKVIKKENLKSVYAAAFTRFADAVQEYEVNVDSAPDPSITKEHFEREMNLIYDHLFSNWLASRDVKVKYAVFEAIGKLSHLVSKERLLRNPSQVISILIGSVKRLPDPYYATACLADVIDAVEAADAAEDIEPVVEPLLTVLFTQVSVSGGDYSRPLSMRNHHEILRCYNVLVRMHGDKLVTGLITRMCSVDENIRLAALTIFKHLITTSMECIESRMEDIVRAVHAKVGQESSNKVKKMLAQLIALFSHRGLIVTDRPESAEFLTFIINLCSLSGDLSVKPTNSNSSSNDHTVTDGELRQLGDNILHLMAKSVPAIEPVLWPSILDYLLRLDHAKAIPSVIKASLEIFKRRNEAQLDVQVTYTEFSHVRGPYDILARLIVLAAFPHTDHRGSLILSFLQHFAVNINKHLVGLWSQRIPLLQHYLESSGGQRMMGCCWDQTQWEQWLLDLLDATVLEIDLEEWTTALLETMWDQLQLYGPDALPERGFLMKCIGLVAKQSSQSVNVVKAMNNVYHFTVHSNDEIVNACSKAFGLCATRHHKTILTRLEELLRLSSNKKSSSFFGLFKDAKLEEKQVLIRNTILHCVGQSALHASAKDLASTADEISLKFVYPGLKGSVDRVKVSALKTTSELALAVHRANSANPDAPIELAHHSDLVHEAVECVKNETWVLEDKLVALDALFYLVQIPPSISQATRCLLLKACFSAVFPGMIAQFNGENVSYSFLSKTEACLKKTVDRLLHIVEELLRQDLQQGSLDEMFTLIEGSLKQDACLAREMATVVLQRALKTFKERVEFKIGEPTQFNPGPFIIGSLVPRCFDTVKAVQVKALDCIHTTLHIVCAYEGLSNDSIDEMLSKLCMLYAIGSPSAHDENEEPIGVKSVAECLSDVLCQRIQHFHLLPLLNSMIDGLLDDHGSKGTSIVLCNLLESRGQEICSQAAKLVGKLYAQLLAMEECAEETRVRVLTSVKVLASCSPREVTQSLLLSPTEEDVLPSIWKVFTQDKSLAKSVLDQLLEILSNSKESLLFHEEFERLGNKIVRVARHETVAVLLALRYMFEMHEMEQILEGEFATIFVALVCTLSSLMGISRTKLPAKPNLNHVDRVGRRGSAISTMTSGGSSSPIIRASDTLAAFLSCKGCPTASRIVSVSTDKLLINLEQEDDYVKMAEFVFAISQSIIGDWPQFLAKLSSTFAHFNQSPMVGHRLATLAFSRQILTTDLPVTDSSLKLDAVNTLLTSLQWEKDSGERSVSWSNGGVKIDDEDMSEAKVSKSQIESTAMRILCLDGLAELQMGHCLGQEDEIVPRVLSAFLDAIGDDFRSDLNHAALAGLCKLLSSDAVNENYVFQLMSDIANCVRPFFDNGQEQEASAAIDCFSALSDYALHAYKDVYLDHVHSVFVSLLLHANDGRAQVQDSSRAALLNVYPLLMTSDEASSLKDNDYILSLRKVCASTSLREMLPLYVSAVCGHLSSTNTRLKINAIHLMTILVLQIEDLTPLRENGSAENICRSLAALMSGDQSPDVREAAASSIGKVFVKLNT